MELKPQRPTKPRIPWVWVILLLATIVWNAALFLRTSEPQADIPYSTFLNHVHEDNIASVDIQGDQISGEFVNPVVWPQPTPGPTPANTPVLTTTSPITYTAFLTTFPEAVGDPNLLPLLEAHKVVVNVKPPQTPWFTILLTDGLPVLLMLLVLFWLGRQAVRSQGGIFNFGRSRVRSSLAGGTQRHIR